MFLGLPVPSLWIRYSHSVCMGSNTTAQIHLTQVLRNTVVLITTMLRKFHRKKRTKQVCIPVGCLPASVAATKCKCCGKGGLCTGGLCPGGLCPGSLCPEGDPPVNRMTDTSKNITLPKTSFAGGKNA